MCGCPSPTHLSATILARTSCASQGLRSHPSEQGVTGRHQLLQRVCSAAKSCLTLCDPVDCSPPGSSVHGTLQARTLERVAISLSRGSSRPRHRTRVLALNVAQINRWLYSVLGRGQFSLDCGLITCFLESLQLHIHHSKARFQDKLFNITVIQVYAPNTNAKEAEVEWFYKDL